MNFETVDWEVEAKRVARAFGVVGECEFVREENHTIRLWMREPRTIACLNSEEALVYEVFTQYARTGAGLVLEVLIDIEYISFELSNGINGDECLFTHVMFRQDSSLAHLGAVNRDYIAEMTEALFHLELLTPEVEAELGLGVSAHDKLEWARDYEERYGV